MRLVALFGIYWGQEKRELPDIPWLHGQGRFNLEKNPPIADIFQYPLTGLRILHFRLLHDKPNRQLKVKSRMPSLVHGNSSHPQSG
jgi:hypothetical protein